MGYVLYRYRRGLLAHHGSWFLIGVLSVFGDQIKLAVPAPTYMVTTYLLGLAWFFFGARLGILLNADNLLPGTYFKVMVAPFLMVCVLMMVTAILLG